MVSPLDSIRSSVAAIEQLSTEECDSAYEEGVRDYLNGVTAFDNPYMPEAEPEGKFSPLYYSWMAGWSTGKCSEARDSALYEAFDPYEAHVLLTLVGPFIKKYGNHQGHNCHYEIVLQRLFGILGKKAQTAHNVSNKKL